MPQRILFPPGYVDSLAGDEQAVQNHAPFPVAGKLQLFLEDYRRPGAVDRPDFNLTPCSVDDGQSLFVPGAVLDENYPRIAAEFRQRIGDGRLYVDACRSLKRYADNLPLDRACPAGTRILPSAGIPAEAVMERTERRVGIFHPGGVDHDPAAARVEKDHPMFRGDLLVSPRNNLGGSLVTHVFQIADDDTIPGDGGIPVGCLVPHLDLQAPVGTVIIGGGMELKAVEGGYVAVQHPAGDRQRHVQRLRQVSDVGLRHRQVEERSIEAKRMETEMPAVRQVRRSERRPGEGEGAQPPEENPHVRNVPGAAPGLNTPHFHRAGGVVERRAEEFEEGSVAQAGDRAVAGPYMIQVLGRRQPFEELHRPSRPPGHVSRQLFENRSGSLSPAIGDGVPHFRTRRQRLSFAAAQTVKPEQVGQVRKRPRRGGFDEIIVVQLRQFLFQYFGLPGNHFNQLAQGAESLPFHEGKTY